MNGYRSDTQLPYDTINYDEMTVGGIVAKREEKLQTNFLGAAEKFMRYATIPLVLSDIFNPKFSYRPKDNYERFGAVLGLPLALSTTYGIIMSSSDISDMLLTLPLLSNIISLSFLVANSKVKNNLESKIQGEQ